MRVRHCATVTTVSAATARDAHAGRCQPVQVVKGMERDSRSATIAPGVSAATGKVTTGVRLSGKLL